MLGPYSSGLTKAIAPVTEKYQIPMVEAEGASRSLFTQGYKYLFAVLSTSEQYLASSIALAAEMAEKNGKQPSDVRIAMAFENDPFSLDVRQGVVDDAAKYGMQIVIDDKLPRDLSDMSATLTKVKALKPDLLVVSGHSKGAATAARQLAELKIDTPMVAMTHCEAAAITDQFGPSTEGILCPTQWAETLSYADEYFGSAADFDAAFKERFPEYQEPGVPYQSAQAAAAVLVWKDALERANSFDTEAVRDAIAATDMTTFYGGIKFSEEGNNIAKPMVLRQIQDGQYNVVAPSKWASHPVIGRRLLRVCAPAGKLYWVSGVYRHAGEPRASVPGTASQRSTAVGRTLHRRRFRSCGLRPCPGLGRHERQEPGAGRSRHHGRLYRLLPCRARRSSHSRPAGRL